MPYIFEFPTDDLIRLQQRKHLLEEVGVYLEEYEQPVDLTGASDLDEGRRDQSRASMKCVICSFDQGSMSIKKYRAELAIMMSLQTLHQANHTLDDYLHAIHLPTVPM